MVNINSVAVRQISYVSIIVLAIVFVGTLVFYGSSAEAVKSTYKFVIRGDVLEVDRAGNTVRVYSRFTSADAKDELAGSVVEFNVAGAKIYKYNEKLKKGRVTLGALKVGDEVVMEGNKRSSTRFNVSKITKNYHTVNLTGILQGHDVANATFEIDIEKLQRKADNKPYRTTTFPKGERLIVYYDNDSTKILSQGGSEINPDEIANSNEKITVSGITVQYGSRFVAGPDASVRDGKYLF